ncbi:hypothetical protein ES706_02086 [subsurface metagenome]
MGTVSAKDNRLYKWLYFTLRAGIACSLCLVFLGFILFGITKAEFTKSIITLGILILVLTPLLSIVLAMVNFLMQKDKLYLGISIAIVCVLVLSLALALV